MPGGQESSVLRIARFLSAPGRSRAVVYTRRQSRDSVAPHPAHGPVEVVHLGSEKDFLLAPLDSGAGPITESVPSAYLLESLRVDYLLAVSAIRERMDADPGAEHIVISFFMTTNGFIGQQVALTLGIPHVASVQGSDFSRDFRSPYHLQAIRFVVENARLTITNNQEQARVLAGAFPAARAFRTVHNALDEEFAGPVWKLPSAGPLRLAADCEFSFKKGTHVLLRAVADLCERGDSVTLTVAGRIEPKERNYWNACQREYEARHPGVFTFPGWLPADRLREVLLASTVYVSATFGEGCSLAQMRAMALGMPVVATRTGAIQELCQNAAHVALCPPCDAVALSAAIHSMLAGLRGGSIRVESKCVEEWRRHFSPERERCDWEAALSAL